MHKDVHRTQKSSKRFLHFFAFITLRNFCVFLKLDYDYVSFRSFNSGSIDVRIKTVLSAVWQPAAFKDILPNLVN